MVLVYDDDLEFIKGLGGHCHDTVSQCASVLFASRLSLPLPCHKSLETLQPNVLKRHLQSLKPEIQQVLYGECLLNYGHRLCSQKQDHIISDENGPNTNTSTTALTVAMLSKEPRRSTFYFSVCNSSIALPDRSFATDLGTFPEPLAGPLLTTPRAHTPNITDPGKLQVMDISIPLEAAPEGPDIAILPIFSTQEHLSENGSLPSDPSQVLDIQLPPIVSQAPDTR